jgi:hypothetical protein
MVASSLRSGADNADVAEHGLGVGSWDGGGVAARLSVDQLGAEPEEVQAVRIDPVGQDVRQQPGRPRP